MKNIKITKTPTGYVIREHPVNPMVVVYIILQALMGLVMLLLCLWLKPADGGVYLLLIGIFVGMPVAICLPFILWSMGERYEFDEEGIHLRYTLHRGKLLRWEDVQDWGITEVWYSKLPHVTHSIYFSTAVLPVMGTAYKRLDSRKDVLSLQINSLDHRIIVDTGLWDYCRTHMAAQYDE